MAFYGLDAPLQLWSRLPNLICDWATKFEDYDRYLTVQEALHLSSLPSTDFQTAIDLLTLCTVSVDALYRKAGLLLWDLKWEIAYDGARLIIVDTLDHDSVRVTKIVNYEGVNCHVHFNKQAIRDYFRILHPDWHRALIESKELSGQRDESRSFMKIYTQGVSAGKYPDIPTLDPVFAAHQARKYEFVNDACMDRRATEDGDRIAREEATYYARRGALDEFVARNGVTE